jgi:hypothetical protein
MILNGKLRQKASPRVEEPCQWVWASFPLGGRMGLAGCGEEKSDLRDENHPSFESPDRHNKNDDQRRHNLQEFHCLTVSPRGNRVCSKLHNSVSLRVPLPGLPIGWRRLNQSAS